jgi:hypothetical protein
MYDIIVQKAMIIAFIREYKKRNTMSSFKQLFQLALIGRGSGYTIDWTHLVSNTIHIKR